MMKRGLVGCLMVTAGAAAADPVRVAAATVDVDVRVDVHATVTDDTVVMAPGMIAPRRTHRDGIRIEAGMRGSQTSVGGEFNVLAPIAPQWRMGVSATVGACGDGSPFNPKDQGSGTGNPMLGAALEARWEGRGDSHFEVGLLAGVMRTSGDNMAVLGLRLGHAWQWRAATFALSATPAVLVDDTDQRVHPVAWLSLRGGLDL